MTGVRPQQFSPFGVKEKVEGLLNPDSGMDGKRRSKSHVSSGRRSRANKGFYSDDEYDDRYDRRGGGRSRRDDY